MSHGKRVIKVAASLASLMFFLGIVLPSTSANAQIGPGLLTKTKGALAITYRSEAVDATSQSTYTFVSQDIGATPGVRRRVIVLVAGTIPDTTARTITTFTINGISAEVHGKSDGTLLSTGGYRSFVAITSALVPTGTSGDIVMSVSGGALINCKIRVYEVVNGSVAAIKNDSDPSSSNGQTNVQVSFSGSGAAAINNGNAILAVAEKGGVSSSGTFSAVLTTQSTYTHGANVDSSFGDAFSLSAGTKTPIYGTVDDGRYSLIAILVK